jgi:hypothetical protein
VANLEKPLPREGVYLPDGLYADFITAQGRILAVLDAVNAPLAVAHFIRLNEHPAEESPSRICRGPSRTRPAFPQTTIGHFISLADGVAVGFIHTPDSKDAESVKLPKTINPVLKHEGSAFWA